MGIAFLILSLSQSAEIQSFDEALSSKGITTETQLRLIAT